MDKAKLYEIYENKISEILGKNTIISEFFNYFNEDDVEGFLRSLNTDYELNIEELN